MKPGVGIRRVQNLSGSRVYDHRGIGRREGFEGKKQHECCNEKE